MADFDAWKTRVTIPSGSTSPVAVTGCPFTPKLARLTATMKRGGTTFRYLSRGIITPSGQMSLNTRSQDRVTDGVTSTSTLPYNSACLFMDTTISGALTSDGCTLTPAASLDQALTVEIVFLGGDDSDYAAELRLIPSAASPFSAFSSALGFAPNVLEAVCGQRAATTVNASNTIGGFVQGFAVDGDTITQACVGVQMQHNVNPSDTNSHGADGLVLRALSGGSTETEMAVTAFGADNVTLSKSATGAMYALFVAMRVPRAALGSAQLRADETTFNALASVSPPADFTPELVLTACVPGVEALDQTRVANACITLGEAMGTDAAEQGAIAFLDADALARADNYGEQAQGIVGRGLSRAAQETFSTASEVALVGLATGTVQLQMTVPVSDVEGRILTLALGNAPASGGGGGAAGYYLDLYGMR